MGKKHDNYDGHDIDDNPNEHDLADGIVILSEQDFWDDLNEYEKAELREGYAEEIKTPEEFEEYKNSYEYKLAKRRRRTYLMRRFAQCKFEIDFFERSKNMLVYEINKIPKNCPKYMYNLIERDVRRKHGKFMQGLETYIEFCHLFLSIYDKYKGGKKSDSWLLKMLTREYNKYADNHGLEHKTESSFRRKLYLDKELFKKYCNFIDENA